MPACGGRIQGPWSCSGQRYTVPGLGVNWPSCVFLPTMARGKREARKALDIPSPAPRPAPRPLEQAPPGQPRLPGRRDTHRPQNRAAAQWASSALPVCLWRRGRPPCHSPGPQLDRPLRLLAAGGPPRQRHVWKPCPWRGRRLRLNKGAGVSEGSRAAESRAAHPDPGPSPLTGRYRNNVK